MLYRKAQVSDRWLRAPLQAPTALHQPLSYISRSHIADVFASQENGRKDISVCFTGHRAIPPQELPALTERLDRVLEAVKARCPDNVNFIAEVERHRADERKHYVMFKRYYELQHRMPLTVGKTCGHIDHFIERIFGCTIEELDTEAIIADPAEFEKLCRVIMLTEQRGMHQLDILLKNRFVLSDPILVKIFEIIR